MKWRLTAEPVHDRPAVMLKSCKVIKLDVNLGKTWSASWESASEKIFLFDRIRKYF